MHPAFPEIRAPRHDRIHGPDGPAADDSFGKWGLRAPAIPGCCLATHAIAGRERATTSAEDQRLVPAHNGGARSSGSADGSFAAEAATTRSARRLLSSDKEDHVTGAVSGGCSAREGATISASLGEPAADYATRRRRTRGPTASGCAWPRRIRSSAAAPTGSGRGHRNVANPIASSPEEGKTKAMAPLAAPSGPPGSPRFLRSIGTGRPVRDGGHRVVVPDGVQFRRCGNVGRQPGARLSVGCAFGRSGAVPPVQIWGARYCADLASVHV